MTANFVTQQVTAYDATVSGAGSITGYMRTTNPVNFAALSQNFGLFDSAGCTGCISRGTANVQFVGSQAEGAVTSFALTDGVNSAGGVALLAR